jgi:hypothetical protein
LLTYQTCQNHVQRLRVSGKVPLASGSQGHAPGILRSLLPPCCSNPRRACVSPSSYRKANAVRLCECVPGVVSIVKSDGASSHSSNLAKIAAFFVKASSHRANTTPPKPTFERAWSRSGNIPSVLFCHAAVVPHVPHPPFGHPLPHKERERADGVCLLPSSDGRRWPKAG